MSLPLPHPPFPGLAFRSYVGEEDVPRIAQLMRASLAANGDTIGVTEDELRNEFGNTPHPRLLDDMLLGFAGERLVARSWLDWADTPDAATRHYMSWGDVHPDWRRRGIGRAMWRRNVARLRRLARGQTFSGERVLTVPWLRGGDLGGAVLARQLGYRCVRVYHHMTRATLDHIALPPLPPGLEVRPVADAQLRAVWEAMTEAFRDHFGAWDTSEAAFRTWRGSPAFDPTLLIVAFDGHEVAGGAHGLIDPQENAVQGYRRGWVDDVYTRRGWRRRGLASALLGRVLLRLRERGMTSAQLDVDSQNPSHAPTLYRRHGFETDRQASEWHRPLGP